MIEYASYDAGISISTEECEATGLNNIVFP